MEKEQPNTKPMNTYTFQSHPIHKFSPPPNSQFENIIQERVGRNPEENNQTSTTSLREKLPNCKKNSLKFCRRISKMIIDKVSTRPFESASILYKIVVFFQTSLEQQINMFSGAITDSKEFSNIHLDLIKKIWEKNRGILSEKKNNKLSLVNYEEWETIFSKKGFNDRLTTVSNDFSILLNSIEFADESSFRAFIGFYSKFLFTLNTCILNWVILVDMPRDKDVRSAIPEIDNFGLMIAVPWLYKHYNHTKAKFALECCTQCKICRSSLLPDDFQQRLADSRTKYISFKSVVKKRLLDKNYNDSNVGFALFSFMACDLWMIPDKTLTL